MAHCLIFVATLCAERTASAAVCQPDDEFCTEPEGDAGASDGSATPGGQVGIDEPCWSPEFGDLCNEPPPPCEDPDPPQLTFSKDREGNEPPGEEIFVVHDPGRTVSCIYVHGVTKTGYVRLFDRLLAESCSDQRDETAYVTVENSCNAAGWAVEANAGDRFVLLDADNGGVCEKDENCADGLVCRDAFSTHGRCCVPDRPAFIGTFLLVAGEPNKLCLHHFCPDWEQARAAGEDLGFVTNDCGDPGSINSVHLRLDDTFVGCEEDTMLKPCNWGCSEGACLPDPCQAKDCPAFCKDGVCLDDNPCATLQCKHGCKNGRCLQPPSAPGPDDDSDGYPQTADCDDGNGAVNPGAAENCTNGIDDDCDGFIDEQADCPSARDDGGSPGNGSASDGGSSADDDSGSDGDGCNCTVRSLPLGPGGAWICLFGLAWILRARDKRRASSRRR